MNDHELLQQYAEHGSHEAFRTLAERYTPLVYSSACRRVQDESLAEDIVQAVFIILAQKARKVAKHRNLAGWLVNTAKHVSFRAAREQRRRKQREKTFQEMKNMEKKSQEKDRVWQELRPVLDSAIDRLSSKEKTAILLRYFRSYSYVRIGEELDVSENTATKRVERALKKMRKIVAKKRIKVTSVLLGSILASKAVEAAPSGLAASCTDVALRIASGAGIGAAESYTIAKGTMKMMMWTKIKTAAAVIAGVILTGAGGAVGVRHLAVAQEASSKQVKDQTGTMLPEDSPVSTRSYWRYWLTYAPPRALRDGKLVPSRYRFNVNWGGTSWNQGRTAPPPSGWAGADFDDSSWPVARVPMNMVPIEMACQHMIRKTFFRTRFIVPDPGRVNKLVFTAEYNGGMIVYVNGKELGRQHIPTHGLLAEEGFAEPFPEAAYRLVSEEMKKLARETRLLDPYRKTWNWRRLSPVAIGKPYRENKEDEARRRITQQIRNLCDRRISLDIPPGILRKGVNVLALELRLSPYRGKRVPSGDGRMSTAGWPHGLVRWVTLDAEPDNAVTSGDRRPDGVQVWAEDIHRRVMTEEYLEPGVKAERTVRIVGTRGGRHSGQVIVGTAKGIGSPSAKLPGLTGPGGAKISASGISLRWGRPLDRLETHRRLKELLEKKGGRASADLTWMALFRYRQPVWAFRERASRLNYPREIPLGWWREKLGSRKMKPSCDLLKKYGKGLLLYDRLSDEAPGHVAANSCQPLWVTVEVPADAKPGFYTGTLKLSAEGLTGTDLAVNLQVFDWQVPASKDFKIYSGIEQCPWSLAKCAGVKPWSDEHWKLIEASLKWCGRLGARVAGIPVVHNTDIDNGKDTMVKWIRKKDGVYGYDFSIMDRYLGLWRKHCHTQSDVIVHILGIEKWTRNRANYTPGTVTVLDPETKQESAFAPISKEATQEGLRIWTDFCKALRGHLNAMDIPDDRILFGTFGDKVGGLNTTLVNSLARELPGVGWARSSHYGGKKGTWGGKEVADRVQWDVAIRAACQYVRGGSCPFAMGRGEYRVLRRRSWSNPEGPLHNPFGDNDVISINPPGPVWGLRKYPEMVITSAYRGFAKILLDGYERAPLGWGPSIRWLAYPEREGVEGSVELEILRESLQEAEARIFLEGTEGLPEDIWKLLDRRTERAWHLPAHEKFGRGAEWYGGWQEDSWMLFSTAAKVAGGSVPGEEEKKRFFRNSGDQ